MKFKKHFDNYVLYKRLLKVPPFRKIFLWKAGTLTHNTTFDCLELSMKNAV